MKNKIIGFLLIVPIYIILFGIFKLFNLFNLNNNIEEIIVLIVVYLPILIGLFMLNKKNNKKVNKIIIISLIISLVLSLFFYIDTYFINHIGFNSLFYFFLYLVTIGISRLLLVFYYNKKVNTKKGFIFLILWLTIILLFIMV